MRFPSALVAITSTSPWASRYIVRPSSPAWKMVLPAGKSCSSRALATRCKDLPSSPPKMGALRKKRVREARAERGMAGEEALANGSLGQRAVDGFERLARFEQLGALRGEVRHLARQHVAFGVQCFERAPQILRLIARRLQIAGESLLLCQAVGERPIAGTDLLAQALLFLGGGLDDRPGVLQREQSLVPLALEGRQLPLQLGQKLCPGVHLRGQPPRLVHADARLLGRFLAVSTGALQILGQGEV